MAYTERALDADELLEISVFAKDGLEIVRAGSSLAPEAVVAALDSYIDSTQQELASGSLELSGDDSIFLPLLVGCLFGDQLVKAFGWEWCCLVDGDDEFYAVVQKDRSLFMFPTYFVRDCLEQPNMDCTAMLTFNMLSANRFIDAPQGGYLDVLDHVVRIVPRH